MPGPQRGFGFFSSVRISLEQKGSRSSLHNELRPIHFINRGNSCGCQPLQVYSYYYKIVMLGKMNF
jgi:hypothetical protein